MFVLIVVRKAFVQELEIIFLTHGVMDGLGIVYPQYWIGRHKLYSKLFSNFFHPFKFCCRLHSHNFIINVLFQYFLDFGLFLIIKICD
jgi:hypothetical protein